MATSGDLLTASFGFRQVQLPVQAEDPTLLPDGGGGGGVGATQKRNQNFLDIIKRLMDAKDKGSDTFEGNPNAGIGGVVVPGIGLLPHGE